MELFGKLSALLLNGSIAVMFLGLAALFVYRGAMVRKENEKAKRWAWVSFCCNSFVAAVHVAMTLVGGGGFMLIIALLWGWFAVRDWKMIQTLEGNAPGDGGGS